MFNRTDSTRKKRRGESTSLRRHVFVGVGACLTVALIMYGVWHVTRLPAFTIDDVVVTGGDTIPHELVRREVASVLSGSYVRLIPYTFSLFYPHDRIAGVVGAIPRVRDIVVERDMKRLTINFAEYVPYALWCLSGDETTPCYFLDETGYAFAPGPRLVGGSLVRQIIEGEHELSKRQIFETPTFEQTHALLTRLEDELSLRVTDVFYTKDGDIKLDILYRF
jgi:cell division septal protein FtsQ